jgi:hypothetical protein
MLRTKENKRIQRKPECCDAGITDISNSSMNRVSAYKKSRSESKMASDKAFERISKSFRASGKQLKK